MGASRKKFLGRLEQKSDSPGFEPDSVTDQGRICPDGRVGVVATGMHYPGDLTPERHICRFVDGQGIHVGPEADSSAFVSDIDGQAGFESALPGDQPSCLKRVDNQRGCPELLVTEFWMAVNGAPHLYGCWSKLGGERPYVVYRKSLTH